jgi:5-methylthioadenosine/S-adenosylhomocysteine deaminase
MFRLAWDGGAKVIGCGTSTGRLEVGRRGDVVLLDLASLTAPYSVVDVDVWEILLARGKAAHVRSVIVDGRVLLRDRELAHIDRTALVEEVAAAAAAAVGQRDPGRRALVERIGGQIVRHYQGLSG